MLKQTATLFVLAGLLAFQPSATFAKTKKATETTTTTTTETTTGTTAPAEGTAMKAIKVETKKEKKPLSEKQKKNIAIMRECGAEWRAAKAAGTVKGQKWRNYLKDCRAKKKAA